jgi:hypothetical protein
MAAASPEELERVRAVRHARYLRTRERKLAQARERRRSAAWREKRRSWELSAAYGITAEGYDAILASQGGRCACCGAAANRSGKRLFVDHDHQTGAIRGVICNECNRGIGALGDSVEGVRRALNYLERAQQRPLAASAVVNLLQEAS